MREGFRADMHCHTTCSDGTVNPTDIIHLAAHLDLQGLSITDHDTIDAYQTASPIAKLKEISLISGVEFSAVLRGSSVHILAYSFASSSTLIEQFCKRHLQRRTSRNEQILKLLASHGMPISREDFPAGTLDSKHPIGRPHIALAMVKKGYVSSIQQAFHEYIGDKKSCCVIGDSFTVEETLEIIHAANGLAVIAHPHLIDEDKILRELLLMNFDGIEGYYAKFPRTAQERWVQIGSKKGWIVTGGSDFHGEIKPHLPLGSSWVNEETFLILQKHFLNNEANQTDAINKPL